MEGWRAEQQRQQTNAWSPGQRILNDTGARQPEHTFHQPVPIIARIVWEHDREEHIHTVAAGWSGQNVYVRLPDRRYRLTSVWLDAADFTGRWEGRTGVMSCSARTRTRRPGWSPRAIASFPGVGPVTTAVLLAEIGEDRQRYPADTVLLAEAGLAPVTRSSGRSRSVRFRYAANTRLRETAMWWAYNSMKESPWAAAAFRQARDQRGQRYHRALRGLSARWMRILWRCWTDNVPYDPAKHTSAVAMTTTG